MRLIYGEDDERLIFRFLHGFFFVPILYRLNLIFVLGNRFSLFGSSNFFPFIWLLFYKRFYVFLAIAIRIYLCFREKVLFQFRNFGFISHATRISNTTSFLWKMIKNKFRNNFSRFTKLECFALDIQSQTIQTSKKS